jgi:diguanylate cyclase (GGDEF)-like protein/PAS domain S-box-containing protein
MKLSDTPSMLGCHRNPAYIEVTGSAPPATAPAPTTDDLRRLLADAHEQRLVASVTLHALLAAVECRDSEIAQHCYRTACWSAWMAALARVSSQDTAALVSAALLHEAGSIATPDESQSASPSSDAEWQLMVHTRSASARIVAACGASQQVVSILAAADTSEATQSEAGLRPEIARILAIADAFDAMTGKSRSRKPMAHSDALDRLRAAGSSHFDQDLIALLEVGLATLVAGTTVTGGSLYSLTQSGDSLDSAHPLRTGGVAIVQVLSLVSDAVCMVDSDLRILVWNERAETLTGFPSAEIVGKTWNNAWIDYAGQVSLPREQRRSLMTRCLAAGTLLTERGYLWNVRGDCIPVESRAVPVRDDSDHVLGAIEIIRDLSREFSLQSENEQLRRVSQIDPLTQVSNRTAFERFIKDQVDAVNRVGARCSLILLDIDFFKSINDTYGHPVGDLVLKAFANLLVQGIRPTDVVARYGGEEFAMLLPDCNLATAYERAERLRAEFPSLRLPELKGRGVTASLGVTEIQIGDSQGAVVVRADEALYRAKERGRNRTEVAYAEKATQNEHEYSCSWTISGTADLALLKLSGFVRVWRAQTLQSEPACIRFQIGKPSMLRRVGLRHGEMPVEVQLAFSRTHISERTQVQVAIRPLVGRPAAEEFHARCCEILATLRSHLMADSSAPQSDHAAST